jgi:hypothetical protein
LVKTVFASSVKYTSVLLVPATLMLATLATPLVNTLFPKNGIIQSFFIANAEPKYPYAPLFLALSVLVNLYVLVGNISLATFQTGVGKTNQVMKQNLLSLPVGLALAYLLVAYFFTLGGVDTQASSSLAVIGGIIGILVASVPGMIWGLVWIWKNYRAKADFRISAKIFAASGIASAVTFLAINIFSLPWILTLLAGFLIFLLAFLVTAPLIGAVNLTDVENLVTMFSGLGVISKVLNIPLLFMRKLCKANTSKE